MKRSSAEKKTWTVWIVLWCRSARASILDGQRLFDGMLWVSKKDYSVIRSEGQAVPQIRTLKSENLLCSFHNPASKGGG